MTSYWYDREADGLLIGEAAYTQRLDSGANHTGIVSLEDLLAVDQYSTALKSANRLDVSAWGDSDYRQYGQWVLGLLNEPEYAGIPRSARGARLTRSVLERLSYIGLGPGIVRIRNRFGTMEEFAQSVGGESGRPGLQYESWSVEDFRNYAHQLMISLGRKPTTADYKLEALEGRGPHHDIIIKRVGGIRRLNELIGYTDIGSWDEEDYISWATDVMLANDGTVISLRMLELLSAKGRGPSISAIIPRFGGLESLRALAEEHYRIIRQERASQDAKMMEVYGHLEQKYDISSQDPLRFTAQYVTVQSCLPRENTQTHLSLSDIPFSKLYTELKKYRKTLTYDELEMAASCLGTTRYLWPDNLPQYVVNDKELGYKRPGCRRVIPFAEDIPTGTTDLAS